MSSDYQTCPRCQAVVASSARTCRQCGYKFPGGQVERQSNRGNVSDSLAPLKESAGKLLKLVVIFGVIGLIGWGGFVGVSKFIKSLEPKNPFPADPVETTTEFFTALAQKDNQKCYQLLEISRKIATTIKRNSRDSYSMHFDRIRLYLKEQVGDENFIETMRVSDDGRDVIFDQRIQLTLEFTTSRDSKNSLHYSVAQVKEFPMDIAPGIGLEKRNRGIGKMLEDLDPGDELDDISEIIRRRDYESKRERLQRLITSFKNARQLDTRHTTLQWIIREFHQDKTCQAFLQKLARDETEVMQLRALAQETQGLSGRPAR